METRKTLVLSTCHLKKATVDQLEMLDLDSWPCAGGHYGPYGIFVYAHDENLGTGSDRIPDDLFAVMTFARQHDCDMVLLDRDADVVDALPHWDW